MKLHRLLGALCAGLMLIALPVRAAEQSSYVTPTAGPMPMSTFVGSHLNPAMRALASCSWGSSAPANGPSGAPIAHQCWADTGSAGLAKFKRYDGASWVEVYRVDTVAHTVSLPSISSITVTGAATLGSLGVTGAATVGTTLGVTGAGTFSSTLGVTGNFAVNINKFTVAASSGNTVVAGTLGVTGASALTGAVVVGTGVYNTERLNVTSSGAALTSIGLHQATIKQWSLGMSSSSTTLRLTADGVPGVGTDVATFTNGAVAITGTLAVSGASTLTGNVGVGIAPTGVLHVAAGSNTGLKVTSLDGTTLVGVMYNTGGTSLGIGALTNHGVRFYTNNLDRGGVAAGGTFDIVGSLTVGSTLATTGGATFGSTVSLSPASGSAVINLNAFGAGANEANLNFNDGGGTLKWQLSKSASGTWLIYDAVGALSALQITANTRINIGYTNASSSTATGALVVAGGFGLAGAANIGGAVNIAGITTITNATASTSGGAGALVVTGGIYSGGVVRGSALSAGYGTGTASVSMAGGSGAGNGALFFLSKNGSALWGVGHESAWLGSGTSDAFLFALNAVGNAIRLDGTSLAMTLGSSTAATSTATGSFITPGGAGIGGSVWIGGGVVVGAATGGNIGTGSINISGAYYANGVAVSGTGTVTSVATNAGLTGGTITGSGTIGRAYNEVAAQGAPSNPTGTASATQLMMGLGVTTCRFAPVNSTRMVVTISGTMSVSLPGTISFTGRYGTGAGPANAAAATGTTFTGVQSHYVAVNGATHAVAITNIITGLSAGTTYWIDVSLGTNAGTGTFANITCSAVEP